MDESYIQLLAAAAAAMPLSPFISNNTTLVGQQAMATSPYSLLQNHWLQQQYYQQLALQYLDNIRACSTLTSPFSATSIATLPLSSDTVKDNSSIADAGVTVSSVNTNGIVAPVPKRPRLMLPVVNEEQLLDVQQSQTNEKSAVVVVDQPQPFAFLSTASAACRTSTLSPTTETSAEARCSSSASVDTASNPKEEEEPELFVDIESVDNRPEGRDRRRAYIEFYRKVKSARQREPGSLLSCALCDCQVLSNDNSIHAHVNHHADAGGFWCKLCGVNEVDKYRIYEHMRVYHPNNMELFEDRRDITKLCAVIQECFPRTCPRSKKEVVRGVDNLIKHIEDNKIAEVKCERCDAVVKATKAALTKHAHQHPMYRCKVCKFMAEDLKTQEEHQVELHSVLDPKNVVDYNVCVAADVLARVVQRCFAYILQSNDSKSVDSKN